MNTQSILYKTIKYLILLSLIFKVGDFTVEYTTIFFNDESSLNIDNKEDIETENENESEPENEARETHFIELQKINLTRAQQITNYFFFVEISYLQRHLEDTTPPPELA